MKATNAWRELPEARSAPDEIQDIDVLDERIKACLDELQELYRDRENLVARTTTMVRRTWGNDAAQAFYEQIRSTPDQ